MTCKTTFCKQAIESDIATFLYTHLKDSIHWGNGIKSKKGFTRKAKAITLGQIPEIDQVVSICLPKVTSKNYAILGMYINYYENGQMWTPNHSHKGTHQMVISLGNPRTLIVGKKSYVMSNGDVIIFGSSIHGVPKDNSTTGRISIATFMIPY